MQKEIKLLKGITVHVERHINLEQIKGTVLITCNSKLHTVQESIAFLTVSESQQFYEGVDREFLVEWYLRTLLDKLDGNINLKTQIGG